MGVVELLVSPQDIDTGLQRVLQLGGAIANDAADGQFRIVGVSTGAGVIPVAEIDVAGVAACQVPREGKGGDDLGFAHKQQIAFARPVVGHSRSPFTRFVDQ